MKRFIAATAIALTTVAGAASAMTAPSNADLNEIRGFAAGQDVSHLSNETVQTVLNIIHGGDSESEKWNRVRTILSKN